MPQSHRKSLLHSGFSASVQSTGTFDCPACQKETHYRLVRVWRSVKVGSWSLLPYRKADEYVECRVCFSTYRPDVLLPESKWWGVKPVHLWASRRVMVLMMMADGVMDESEIRTIRKVYSEIGGEQLPASAIRTEAEHAKADARDLRAFLHAMAPRLNERGKLAVINSAYQVAAADGQFQQEELDLMRELVDVLDMERDPFRTLGITMQRGAV